MIRLVGLILFIALIVLIIMKLRRGGSLFRIKMASNRLTLQGKIPGWGWGEVREFLESLNLPSGTTIDGYPDGRRFRLQFSGHLNDGTRQKIRNFLYLKF